MIAKEKGIALARVDADIKSLQDRSKPPRADVSLFNSVWLHFRMKGVTEPQGRELIEAFKRR